MDARKTKREIFYAMSLGLGSGGEQREVKGESTWNPGKTKKRKTSIDYKTFFK